MQVLVHGHKHRNTSLAPVDSQEMFSCNSSTWTFTNVCEGESIRTFPQHTKCQDRKNANSICGSCLDYKNQLKEKIFRSVKRLGSIHHICQLLGVSHHLNVKIIILLCSLKKCMFKKNISVLIILFFSECTLVMVLVLVYKRPLLWSIQTLSLWGYSYV